MNHKPSTLLSITVGVLVLGSTGLALTACSPGSDKAPAAPVAGPATVPATDARTPLYWYDPMVPDKHFDKPGKSPYMDMQLIPKYADEPGAATPPAAADKDAMPGKPQ